MPDDSRSRSHHDRDRNHSRRNSSSRPADQTQGTTIVTYGYRAASLQSMGQTHPDANRDEGPPPVEPMDYVQDRQPEQQTSENASHRQGQDPFLPTTDHESHDSHARDYPPGQTGETSKPREERKSKPSGEEKFNFAGSFWNWGIVRGPSEQDKQLAREKDDLKTKNRKLSRAINALHKENRDNFTKIRELQALTNAHMTTITLHKTDINSLRLQLGQMTQEQQVMEDQIRTAQLAMSKKSSRPKVGLGDEEGTIKGNFMNLHDEIRKWAKRWGGANFSVIESLTGKQKERYLDQLAKVVALEDGQIPYTLKTEEMSVRSSVLCVSAMLGHYICAEVLEAPFRPLRPLVVTQRAQTNDQDENFQRGNANTLQSVVPGDTILRDMYHKLSDLNKSRAQIWRSDMMSILDPAPIDNASQAVLRAQEDAAKRRTQAACDLTLGFLNASVGVLLPQVEAKDVVRRDEQLQSIFQKALDTAGRLWKQLTIVKCVYLEDLKHESFTYESELMGAHPFHKLGLDDEDENRLDNHPIRIVVFPAVKVYGNSDGENYSQDRIWGKAIVWLDE